MLTKWLSERPSRFSGFGGALVPGRHVTDYQMRLFMRHRASDPIAVAAARAGFSGATGYGIAQDPRLPSEKRVPRERCSMRRSFPC
jgi:hypothetical protein